MRLHLGELALVEFANRPHVARGVDDNLGSPVGTTDSRESVRNDADAPARGVRAPTSGPVA